MGVRLPEGLRTNSLACELQTRRTAGLPVLDLTNSNPTRAGFVYPAEIHECLNDARALSYDPCALGSLAAREAVAAFYAQQGMAVCPTRILLTASTSESYAFLFKLLLRPGEEVLTPRPSYPLFDYLAALENVQVRQYALRYDGEWTIDVSAVSEAVTERTRALVVVNPNHPTGSFLKAREWRELVALCAGRGLALISDEVFAPYGFETDERRVRLAAAQTETLAFSLGGLSKACGLPQMKVGWVVIDGPEAAVTQAREQLEWIADTYLSVSAPVQCALPRLLRLGADVRAQIIDRTTTNRAALRRKLLSSTACSLLPAEGGWSGVIRLPRTRSEEQWCLDLLREESVLVQPGYFYDFQTEAFAVVSLITEPAVLSDGIERLLESARQVS